ncbi:hypothetical protein Trydic_g2111 [Trypoxylus dichotomus]
MIKELFKVSLFCTYYCATVNSSNREARSLRLVKIPFLGIGYSCSGCPQHFCDDDPAIIYGYCCGCAGIFDILPVKCPTILNCPLNGYELCNNYEYMMQCCCG